MSNFKGRMRTARRISSRRELVRFAKAASQDAKRSSRALDIPFYIIKDGAIYQVYEGSMIKTATLRKANPERSGLTKGSRICLK
ncbi:hypothetical protein CMT37_12815 [Elizabethkingia anophelis]|nr:hypothetical protein [Elizabethkingia anophelis]